MNQSNDPNYRELLTRIAQAEYRLTKIENTQEQLENTMIPVLLRLHGRGTRPKRTAGGYVTEAFEQVHREMDELTGEIRQMNGKIDIILRHITGQGNS
jgi:hypothetical protein